VVILVKVVYAEEEAVVHDLHAAQEGGVLSHLGHELRQER
jgi:hypothetical protein